MNVEQRIFSKVMLDQITGRKTKLVDKAQKGFLPIPGAEEHAFLMRVLYEEER